MKINTIIVHLGAHFLKLYVESSSFWIGQRETVDCIRCYSQIYFAICMGHAWNWVHWNYCLETFPSMCDSPHLRPGCSGAPWNMDRAVWWIRWVHGCIHIYRCCGAALKNSRLVWNNRSFMTQWAWSLVSDRIGIDLLKAIVRRAGAPNKLHRYLPISRLIQHVGFVFHTMNIPN
jgi:hypothetical protein